MGDLRAQKNQARAEGLAWRNANPDLVAQGYGRCSKCKTVGLKSEIMVPQKSSSGGYRNQCRSCHREVIHNFRAKDPEAERVRNREWRKNNLEAFRHSKRKSYQKHAGKIAVRKKTYRLGQYGLTREKYDAMLQLQQGKCAICGEPPNGRWKKLNIDHCHTTGKVRGLLCTGCNRAIGYLNDDPDRGLKMVEYLKRDVDYAKR